MVTVVTARPEILVGVRLSFQVGVSWSLQVSVLRKMTATFLQMHATDL